MRGGLVTPGSASRPGPNGKSVPSRGPAVVRGPRPNALIYVVLGVILTDVWRLHDLVPPTRLLRPTIVLSLLALAMIAFGGNLSAALGRLRSPIVLWLAALAALMLVGMPFGLDPAQSFESFSSTFLPHVVTGFLVAASVRTLRDAEFLALGTLGGAFVHTVFVHATAPIGPDGRWTVLPHYDVNDLALMLVVMIPLTMYFMRRECSTPRRTFAVVCFALFSYSIVPTGSRGGFLGLAVVLGYLLLRYAAIPARTRLVGVVAALLALAIGGNAYWSRVETIFRPGTDYNWSEETGRLAIWRRGLAHVQDRPLLGLGLNQFRTAESRLWSQARAQRMAGRRPLPARGAHNMYLQVAAELGLPALVVFVLLLGSTWRALTRLRDSRALAGSPGAALSAAFATSVLGFSVCGFFLHAAFFPVLPTLLGFAVALVAVCGARVYTPIPPRGGLFAVGERPRAATV